MTVDQFLLFEPKDDQMGALNSLAFDTKRLVEFLQQKQRVPLTISRAVYSNARQAAEFLEPELMRANAELTKYLAAVGGQ